MPTGFRTRLLEGAQLEKALTLVRLTRDDADIAAWLEFAAAYGDGIGTAEAPCGVIGVEDMRSYILGIFCFRVIRTTPMGALLDCDHFVVPDMVRSGLPFVKLTEAAESLARQYDCDRVRLAIPGLESISSKSANRYRSTLHENGYSLDCLRFEKKIDSDILPFEVRVEG